MKNKNGVSNYLSNNNSTHQVSFSCYIREKTWWTAQLTYLQGKYVEWNFLPQALILNFKSLIKIENI